MRDAWVWLRQRAGSVIGALLVAVVACTWLVVDAGRVPVERVQAGQVARRTLRAPWTFAWNDTLGATEARREAAAEEPPVFLWDEARLVEMEDRLTRAALAARSSSDPGEVFAKEAGVTLDRSALDALAAAGFSDPVIGASLGWLREAFADRLVPGEGAISPRGTIVVVPLAGDRQPFTLDAEDRIASVDDVQQRVRLLAVQERARGAWVEGAEALARAMVVPNLFYDAERTEAARAAASAAVSCEPRVVHRGETLYREGDRITPSQASEVAALMDSARGRRPGVAWVLAAGLVGWMLLGLHLASRHHLRDLHDPRAAWSTAGLLVLSVAVGEGMIALSEAAAPLVRADLPPEVLWTLIPIAGGGMVVRTLMTATRAMVFVIAGAALVALMTGFDALIVTYHLLTGLVAVGAVEWLRRRIEVLRAGLITGVFGAVLVVGLLVVRAWVGSGQASPPADVLLIAGGVALFGGLASSVFVLVFVPVFELAGFVTDWRLLELASLTHPLMRQLMLRAPGTYHHSVMVGTLGEAACEAIGANGTEVKVAAYFHDIGKVLKPGWFIENQHGHNPHAQATPAASAAVLIGHVVEGARMAREHRLPKPIIDNILMHHGTGLIAYFHARAVAESHGRPVSESDFRYPGPKPNTREAGVLMLADKVEAATRTLRDPSPAAFRAMAHHIINSVLADDQLADCPLTWKEIARVTDAFVKVLVGFHHQRTEYPDTAAISRGQYDDGIQPVEPLGTVIQLPPSALRSSGRLWTDEAVLDEATDHDAPDYEAVHHLPRGGAGG
ncbi:MAG: hypothetical protein RLZZ383_1855 [Pseudomonadota bacterium]